MHGSADPLRGLLNAAAVRERAHEMLDLALDGRASRAGRSTSTGSAPRPS